MTSWGDPRSTGNLYAVDAAIAMTALDRLLPELAAENLITLPEDT